MTGLAPFRPDLPIQVPPELPPGNPQNVRPLPMLAILLLGNFSLVFLALQERLISSLCFWGMAACYLRFGIRNPPRIDDRRFCAYGRRALDAGHPLGCARGSKELICSGRPEQVADSY